MRRSFPVLAGAVLSSAVLTACGPAEVVVNAEIDTPDPQSGDTVQRALTGLEVMLLPYDRDAVFDSFSTAAATPEPEIPPDLLAAQEEVADARDVWSQAEARWNTLRDTLQTLNDQMSQFNRGEAQYVALFREFNELEGQLGTVERRMETAFQRFDSLSKAIIGRSQEVRLQRDEWANEAFAEVDQVFLMKLRASGLDAVVDTTDAQGMVRVQADPGTYWVHARYDLPYSELYWNIPIEVARGEPTQIRLTRDNAERRPKL